MKLAGQDLFNAIEDAKEIGVEPWRWGTNRTYVLAKDGRHYQFTVQFHHEEGVDRDAEADAFEVVAREKTIIEWVPGTATLSESTPVGEK